MASRLHRASARRYSRVLAALLAVAAFSSCAFDPPTIQRTPREVAVESNAKGRVSARRGGVAAGAETPGTPGSEVEVPGEQLAALEVDLTNFKERLIGLDSDEINDLMGTPGLERAEPPALIWQYRSSTCTVDIFMFDDGGGSTVDHVEVRGADSDTTDEKACFTGLLKNSAASGGRKPVAAPAPAAAPSKPVQRGAATPARTPPAAAAPPVAPASAPRAPQADFEEDDDGAPPTGAAATAPTPPAAAPPAPPSATPKKPEFEIEDDPDKMGPARSDDDPAGRNEDLIE